VHDILLCKCERTVAFFVMVKCRRKVLFVPHDIFYDEIVV
jgi:hypothetical protein